MWKASHFLLHSFISLIILSRIFCYITVSHKCASASELPPALREPVFTFLWDAFIQLQQSLCLYSRVACHFSSFALCRSAFNAFFFSFQRGLQAIPAAGSRGAVRIIQVFPESQPMTVIREMLLSRLVDHSLCSFEWKCHYLQWGNFKQLHSVG